MTFRNTKRKPSRADLEQVIARAEAVYAIRSDCFHDPNTVHRKLILLGFALKRYAGQLPAEGANDNRAKQTTTKGHNQSRR